MMNFTTTTRRSRRSRPLSPTRSSGPSIRKWEISCQAAETCLGITWAWNDTPIAVLAHAELLLPGGYRLASQVLLSQDGTTRGRPNPAPHQQSDSMRDLPMRQNTHSITVSGEQPLSQQRHHHQLWQTVQPQLHHRPPPYISSHNEFYPNGTATCWSPNPNPLQNQTMNMTLLSLDYSPMREDRLANPDAFAVCPVTSFYDYLTTLLESSVNITYSSSSSPSSSSSSPSTNKTSSWGFQQISQAAPSMERILTSDLQSIAADIAASLTRYSHERSNTRTVAGTVFVPRVYVAVAWGFLALPAVVYCVGDGCACFDGFRAGEEVVCEEC